MVTTPDLTTPDGALRRQVGRGLAWSMLNNVVARLTNVCVGVVLARILIPEDYGVFTASLVLINAALSMNELGVSLAVVRWPGSPDRIGPTVTTLSLVWSALLYVAIWLAAPAAAAALGSPGAAPVIRVLGLCVLVDALATVPAALMTRTFMQRERMVIDVVSLAGSSVLSILLAARGFGAWSLAWGMLLSSVLSGVITVVWAPRRYWPGLDRSVLRELLGFGVPLAGASALVFLCLNVDFIVVGRELGPQALGFYALAFSVCSWPVMLMSVAIRRVSFAGFSRVAERSSDAAAAFVRSGALVLGATLPMCALLAAYARPAVLVLYGEQWLPAVDALSLLCVLGAVRIFVELGYDFLAATGSSRSNLLLQGVWFVILLPGLVVGARLDGIRGVAAAHAVIAVLVVLPLLFVLLSRRGLSVSALAQASWRGLASVGLIGLSAMAADMVLLHPASQLLLGGGVSVLLALLVLYPLRQLAFGAQPSRD
jgi:O-antigen/teichoic acid export membrane protein